MRRCFVPRASFQELETVRRWTSRGVSLSTFRSGRYGGRAPVCSSAYTQWSSRWLLHCFSWKLPGSMKPSEFSMDDVFGLAEPQSRANSPPLVPVGASLRLQAGNFNRGNWENTSFFP
ncbi:hypothetical protein HPP92_018967 [Vanilla planifolia]|uniref:Uncharacterized protein n=1 Tax=Vanilla planifolia TaxID=51239 RepID=A0A835Q4Y7_VANPL|nr:hypothetical protein HPP92_018967 [Vanilla planifolia]